MPEKEVPAAKYMSTVRLAIPVCTDQPRYCCLNATYQPDLAGASPGRHGQMHLLELTWTGEHINSFEVHFLHHGIAEAS